MKKIFPLFLLICITLSFFSACTKPQIPVFEEEETEINFRGSNFTVYIDSTFKLFRKEGQNASDDRFNQRLRDIQDKYNLFFSEIPSDNIAIDFMTGSLTGNIVADVVIAKEPGKLFETYKINAIVPVEDILENPHNIKYGTEKIAEGTMFAGKQYGVFPYLHDTPPEISGLLSLVMDYVEEFNLSDPHEAIENGEWDWTHFKAFIAEATFSDGDNDYVGLTLSGANNSSNSFAPFIFANGGTMMKYSETRGYTVAFDSPEAIEAMEFVSEIFTSPYADCPGNDEKDYVLNLGSPNFNSSEYEIHVLPIPYGPNGSPDSVSTIFHSCDFWAFPIFSIYSPAEISVIIDNLFEPLSEFYPNGWKDYMLDNCFYDDQDYEYYCHATDNVNYIDDALYTNVFYPLLQRITAGTDSVQSSIESIKSTIQERLDNKYNK